MRIVFAGTPSVAVPTLRALAASHHDVVCVLTRPPDRRGRGKTLFPSPVAELATELGITVCESSRPRDPWVQEMLAEARPDLGIVVAYGGLLPVSVLEIPRHGWVNLHFSDLPRWRGAAPVQHAICARDSHTATCVFQLEEGLDTGPVFARERVPLEGTETTDSLLADLGQRGAKQILAVAAEIEGGTARSVPQDEGPAGDAVTLAPRLTKDDAFVSFAESALDVDATVRSVTANPGAWTTIDGATTLKLGPVRPLVSATSPGVGRIIADKRRVIIGCGVGAVELGQVAPAGKNWMDAADWWRGARLGETTKLGVRRG